LGGGANVRWALSFFTPIRDTFNYCTLLLFFPPIFFSPVQGGFFLWDVPAADSFLSKTKKKKTFGRFSARLSDCRQPGVESPSSSTPPPISHTPLHISLGRRTRGLPVSPETCRPPPGAPEGSGLEGPVAYGWGAGGERRPPLFPHSSSNPSRSSTFLTPHPHNNLCLSLSPLPFSTPGTPPPSTSPPHHLFSLPSRSSPRPPCRPILPPLGGTTCGAHQGGCFCSFIFPSLVFSLILHTYFFASCFPCPPLFLTCVRVCWRHDDVERPICFWFFAP